MNWEFRGEFSVSGLGGTRVIPGVSAQAAFAELSYFLKDFLRKKTPACSVLAMKNCFL